MKIVELELAQEVEQELAKELSLDFMAQKVEHQLAKELSWDLTPLPIPTGILEIVMKIAQLEFAQEVEQDLLKKLALARSDGTERGTPACKGVGPRFDDELAQKFLKMENLFSLDFHYNVARMLQPIPRSFRLLEFP
ncbi:Hypothetical predicted protein [Olea europaea subsp. europaea]|uniref:Uncharacterized protein n=1 Tax=Olea europaea subsp. europaea TaxID=158383 RepID=A0A8S0QZR4_OLEEU|nr:Hypothetical predicted protein [Olea europaea subsp. europaea]